MPSPSNSSRSPHPLSPLFVVWSSPPVPLSVAERGDVLSFPSPEGRGGQGVRTSTGPSAPARGQLQDDAVGDLTQRQDDLHSAELGGGAGHPGDDRGFAVLGDPATPGVPDRAH